MIKNYILLKPFSQQIAYQYCGVPFTYQKEKGDIVRGFLVNGYLRYSIQCPSKETVTGIRIPQNIVREQLVGISVEKKSSIDGTETVALENNKPSIFTTKNIVMGLVGIAIVYGILKFTKSIK